MFLSRLDQPDCVNLLSCYFFPNSDIDAWWYNSTKCSGPEDRGIVIRNKGNEDLHSIQIPWSLDD